MKRDYPSLVQQWPSSGISQREFCSKHDLVFATFQYWRYKLNKKAMQPINGFIEVVTPEKESTPIVELHFVNGHRLLFYKMPDAGLVKALVR